MMLEKEFEFFKKNRKELLKKYKNLYIVIKDEKVVGSYKTQSEALSESAKKFELGTFLIQKVLKNEEDLIQHFHSRVVFN